MDSKVVLQTAVAILVGYLFIKQWEELQGSPVLVFSLGMVATGAALIWALRRARRQREQAEMAAHIARQEASREQTDAR
jgi:hypothetical protein